jgi:hypothetical protein
MEGDSIMKSFLKYYILILLTFLPVQSLLSQWVQTHFPAFRGVTSFAIHIINEDTILYAGTFSNGIFFTSDKGEIWDSFNTGLTNKYVNSLLTMDTNLFAGTGGGIFRLNNYLKTWDSFNTGLENSEQRSVRSLVSDETIIYAGTFGGVFFSPDYGNNWINMPGLNDIQALAVTDTAIFASQGAWNYHSAIFLSSASEIGWSEIFAGNGGDRIGHYYSALAVIDTILLAGSYRSRDAGMYGIYIIDYLGGRWGIYDRSLYLTDIYSFTIYENGIFAGGDSGVYYSNDYGANWSNIGLAEETVNSLIIYDNFLFAGTGSAGFPDGRIWKRPLSEIITSVNQEINNLPNYYKLEQNYPNPFNPVTQIKYSIQGDSYLSLKIYNILGQEEVILFEGFQQAGEYTAIFDAKELASGIYLYQMKANNGIQNFEQTKKLLLIK